MTAAATAAVAASTSGATQQSVKLSELASMPEAKRRSLLGKELAKSAGAAGRSASQLVKCVPASLNRSINQAPLQHVVPDATYSILAKSVPKSSNSRIKDIMTDT